MMSWSTVGGAVVSVPLCRARGSVSVRFLSSLHPGSEVCLLLPA